MIVLCEPDPAVAEGLARQLGDMRVVGRLAEIPNTDLAILGPGIDFEDALRHSKNATMPTVLLRDVVSPTVARRAEAAGITEVVALTWATVWG